MWGSMMVTIFRPFLASLFCILSGVGNAAASQVMYRFPSVCSMSSHSTSYGMLYVSNLPSTSATSFSSL